MKTDDPGERFLFAANPIGQLLPMFAQGKFSEVELYEYGTEHNWSDEVPEPPGIGLWVWEYSPSGGAYDPWNGDYDGVDIDHGTWRPLTAVEWHFVQQGENPWIPLMESEERAIQEEEKNDFCNRQGSEQDQGNFGSGRHWTL
jgi:hypothetical protein